MRVRGATGRPWDEENHPPSHIPPPGRSSACSRATSARPGAVTTCASSTATRTSGATSSWTSESAGEATPFPLDLFPRPKPPQLHSSEQRYQKSALHSPVGPRDVVCVPGGGVAALTCAVQPPPPPSPLPRVLILEKVRPGRRPTTYYVRHHPHPLPLPHRRSRSWLVPTASSRAG